MNDDFMYADDMDIKNTMETPTFYANIMAENVLNIMKIS